MTGQTEKAQGGVDAPASRLLFCLLFGAGTAVHFVLPVWAGLFAERFGFSAAEIGWLLSADMSANAVATLAARLWIHRVHLRHAILLGLVLYVGGNLACLGITEFGALLVLRYAVGIGMGTLVAVSAAGIGATSKPDRNFGFALSTQVTIGGALLFSTPILVAAGGIASFYVVLAVLMGSVLLLIGRTPAAFDKPAAASPASPLGLNGPLLLGFGGIVLFFVGMNGFWSFVERIADQKGFTGEFTSVVLAVSVLVSVFGSLLAAWMSDRYGRIGPILIGCSITIGSVLLLLIGPSHLLFFVSINLFNWMYNFIIPFQSGWIADLDTTGRNITVLPAVQGAGISLGPIVAGSLVAGTDYLPVIPMSVVVLVLAALAFSTLKVVTSERTGGTGARLGAIARRT